MRFILSLLAAVLFIQASSSTSVLLPRDPRGAGGGGGSGGGGGGGGRGGGRGRGGGGTVPVVDTTQHIGSAFSSGAGRGVSGDTGHSAIAYYSMGVGSRQANFFGGGGGRRLTLSEDSVFKGREMGGGERADVPGTRSYGSGYPYSNRDVHKYGVVGQPLPFGFFPIYWAGHGRSDEYGGNRTIQYQRPGGDQLIVQLTPATNSSWGNNTEALGQVNQTLWMLGDVSSVNALLSVLQDPHEYYTYGCNVAKMTTRSFNGSRPETAIRFDNIIQWYRSSSFALAYTGYNNTYALPPLNETAGLGWNDSTPLPATLASSSFLQCINKTIIASLPILDQGPPQRLEPGQIAGIIIGSVFALLLVIFCILMCMSVKRIKKIASNAQGQQRKTPLSTSDVHGPFYTAAAKATPGAEPLPGSTLHANENAVKEEKRSLLSSPAPSSALRESVNATGSGHGGSRRGSNDSARTLVMNPVHTH